MICSTRFERRALCEVRAPPPPNHCESKLCVLSRRALFSSALRRLCANSHDPQHGGQSSSPAPCAAGLHVRSDGHHRNGVSTIKWLQVLLFALGRRNLWNLWNLWIIFSLSLLTTQEFSRNRYAPIELVLEVLVRLLRRATGAEEAYQNLRHPELQLNVPAHAKHPGWHVDLVSGGGHTSPAAETLVGAWKGPDLLLVKESKNLQL